MTSRSPTNTGASVMARDRRPETDPIGRKSGAVMRAHERLIWERTVKPLITDQIISEHHTRPFGIHSPALNVVLDFLRRDTDKDLPRYVSVMTVPGREWRIATHSRIRGRPLAILNEGAFGSEADVERAIFVRRLRDRDIRLD